MDSLASRVQSSIKDKKGVENVVADHLSRLAIAHNSHSLPINDDFPEESLMLIEVAPWYAHIANYLVTGEVPNYVSKWVEAIPCKTNDHRVVLKFLKENIFSRFGVPKAIISDGGTHFCNKSFETLLAKYGVKHKNSLQDHSWNVPYRLVYGKACHLPVEVEYKAWWAIKKLNMDLSRAGMKSLPQRIPKGQRVLLYDSKLHIFGKVEVKVDRSFTIQQVHSNGVVELLNSNSTGVSKSMAIVSSHLEPFSRDKEEIILLEPHQA
ncbi:hypothetical protein CK203_056485 [Vitis vinifera]|uniref:Integrase catalytic domain-containing protein n=1 Tax=Vitis vinifera TaxID=29760 RepID=A0A438GTP9_VITVI|nr:hypothetical protein CK203_056485 [Vitis vinifera]